MKYLLRIAVAGLGLTIGSCTKVNEVQPLIVEEIRDTTEKQISSPSTGIKMKDMLGINAFEWDYVDPNATGVIDEAKMNLIKSFGGVRHYLDWQRIEPKEGGFTFSPSHYGGWNYDLMYQRSKQDGIFILADIKTVPDWLLSTYPSNMRDSENIPMAYNMPREEPSSYIQQAKAGFQFTARYGSNKNVNSNLVTVNTSSRWTLDKVNEVKIGMDLVKYIECDNERDKWWKGKKAEQTPEEYAANLSAFYDGHKNSLGNNVGVKTADPNMKVVMGGLARPDVGYVKKMVEWCRKNRGMKNGKVDLCFDVINYHHYSNNHESNTVKRGSAPEAGNLGKKADEFVAFAKTLSPDMEVWVTETGYDINQGSTQKAIPLKNKSELITQADWSIRTALFYARKGIKKVFFYMLSDVSKSSNTNYSSSGFKDGMQRRPVINYFSQVKNLMGDFEYSETISNDPHVDIYTLNREKIYALSLPTETDQEIDYTFKLGQGVKQVILYTLNPENTQIKQQNIKVENGSLNIKVGESPVFVKTSN